MDEGDWERMYGKTPTVYGESKMIEIQKNYKLTLTEAQARELYLLLRTERDMDVSRLKELAPVHNELKKLFDTGIK